MARIRTIKPEFWSSEQVMSCSPVARLLFIGIWNFCDDNGVHPLKPVSLKALIFPGDAMDSTSIRRLLSELSENDLITLFEHSGKEYLHVTGWQHQRIDKPTIKYPDPKTGNPLKTKTSQEKFDEHSTSTIGALSEASATEGKGIGKGVDQKTPLTPKPKKPKVEFDPDWFATFWKLYPNKTAKPKALESFKRKCANAEDFERIMNGLKQHVLSELFVKDAGRFQPHPTTWLNQERYNDEVKPYVQGFESNTGGNRKGGTSLVDRVRQANAHLLDDEPPAWEPEPGAFDAEFERVDETDGSLVGFDD